MKGKKTNQKNSLKRLSPLIALVASVVVVFCLVFLVVRPVNVSNMGGMHSWLSGSTIKFVNNWLENGPINEKFTTYESPNTIEFNSAEERGPYLSYPTGETFVVYSAVKLAGRQELTISFLHKFQLILFCLEAILLAIFVYVFLNRTLKYKSNAGRYVIALSTASFWMILPTCNYYLANIFFADQCVILWVFALILVEYLYKTAQKESKTTHLKIIRSLILFTGMLIDYYFWLAAFFMFLFEIIESIIKKKQKKDFIPIKRILLWFGIPVALAVGLYFVQLIQTPNWLEFMKGRYDIRVAGKNDNSLAWEISKIGYNFILAFTPGTIMSIYLIVAMIELGVAALIMTIRRKAYSKLFLNPGLSIVCSSIIAIVAQIAFFKNHSAIHEFSMIKVAWIVALLPIFALLILKKTKQADKLPTLPTFLVLLFICLLATGVPVSTVDFYEKRYVEEDYILEKLIRKETNENDVLFSFSKEIPINPPQALAIAKKQVYLVSLAEEIDNKFPNLSDKATKVLIVEKDSEITDKAKQLERCLSKTNKIRYEDENYKFIEITETAKCSKGE